MSAVNNLPWLIEFMKVCFVKEGHLCYKWETDWVILQRDHVICRFFSSFIALLIHSIISAGSCSMWPVSQWKSAPWTSCWHVFTVVQPGNRSVTRCSVTHPERRRCIQSNTQPPSVPKPFIYSQVSAISQIGKKKLAKWIKIQTVFWGLIFYPSPHDRIVWSCLSVGF